MIIRRLEFSGIGPFGKKQSIDFTELTQNGIFLLEGPTGAGKSSILDALVFALYGSVAGKDSSDERLRSTYASAQEESYVDLIFTTSSGTYRVWRSPAWKKPKKRGEGFTEQAQKARLWKLSEAALESGNLEDTQAISSQTRESNQELREIIGLDKQQFLQTVLLPQGQFADFLRLKSAERAPLLEKIFATTPYRNLAELLQSEARKTQKEIAAAYTSYQNAIETWLGIEAIDSDIRAKITAARADLTEIFPASASCDKKLLALLTQGATALADSAVKKADNAQAARATAEEFRSRWEAAKDLTAALELREKLEAEWEELQKEKPKISDLRQQLEKHQQSTTAYKELQSWRQQQENYTEQLTELLATADTETTEKSTVSAAELDSPEAAGTEARAATTIINAIGEIGETFSAAVSQLEAKIFSPPAAALEQEMPDFLADNAENMLQEHLQSAAELLGSLSYPQKLEEELSQHRKEVEKLRTELQAQKESQEVAEAKQAELQKEIATLERELPAKQLQQGKLPLLEKEAAELELATQLRTEKLEIKEQIAEVKNALEIEKQSYRSEEALLHQLSENWLNSTAASLAKDLTPGDPCPVCGSKDHPNPAPISAHYTSYEEVTSQQEKLQAQGQQVQKYDKSLLELNTRKDDLEKRLPADEEEKLAKKSRQLAEKLTSAQAAAQEVGEYQEQLEKLRPELEAQNTLLSSLAEKMIAGQERQKQIEKEIAEASCEIAAACGDFTSVAERADAATQEQKSLQLLQKQLSALKITAAEVRRQGRKYLEELAAGECGSTTELEATYLPPDSLAEITEKVTTYQEKCTKNKIRRQDTKLQELPRCPAPDLTAAAAAWEEASAAQQEAEQQAGRAKQGAEDARRLLVPVQKSARTWHKKAQAATEIIRLASIANAGEFSTSRIPLNMWVLLHRFEAVVNRANEHLENISAGRYALIRSEDESKKIRKTGLGLSVIDHDGSPTGDIIRPTASLSGGETFYTSLALALALAEIVQEENGGIRIDTLLIDEGFGTLSAGVRDAVMQTLRTLTAQGRIVGIVSHVEELKSIIPSRVSISPTPTCGSELRTIC